MFIRRSSKPSTALNSEGCDGEEGERRQRGVNTAVLFAEAVDSINKANSYVDEGHEVAAATIDLLDGKADQAETQDAIKSLGVAAVKIFALLQAAATPEAIAAIDAVASMWAG